MGKYSIVRILEEFKLCSPNCCFLIGGAIVLRVPYRRTCFPNGVNMWMWPVLSTLGKQNLVTGVENMAARTEYKIPLGKTQRFRKELAFLLDQPLFTLHHIESMSCLFQRWDPREPECGGEV